MSTNEKPPKGVHKRDVARNARLLFHFQKLRQKFDLEEAVKLNATLHQMEARGDIIAPTIQKLWTLLVFQIDAERMNGDMTEGNAAA